MRAAYTRIFVVEESAHRGVHVETRRTDVHVRTLGGTPAAAAVFPAAILRRSLSRAMYSA